MSEQASALAVAARSTLQYAGLMSAVDEVQRCVLPWVSAAVFDASAAKRDASATVMCGKTPATKTTRAALVCRFCPARLAADEDPLSASGSPATLNTVVSRARRAQR
jgi:hypothetical protein